MKKPYKILLIVVSVVLGFLAIGAMLLNSIFSGMCGNEVFGEYLSPNKESKAVVFQRDCGATTGFSTQISIIGARDALKNEAGNIFIVNGHPKTTRPIVTWVSENSLVVKSTMTKSASRAESVWGINDKVSIRYE